MRDANFRAYDKRTNQVGEVVFVNFATQTIGFYIRTQYSAVKIAERAIKDIELMQNTGLKDKNGVEIYKGDIVEIYSKIAHTRTKGAVYYDERVCAFMVDDIVFKQYLPITQDDEIEVIGNVYENSDLLKELSK